MKYMLLINLPSEGFSYQPSPEEGRKMMTAYDEYNKMLDSKGARIAGEALHPPATATTVRVRDGKTVTTDGPFAETKEQLGGYYVVEAKDLDEAIEFAAQIPNARDGSIEIRPIMVFDA
jgi:hypothetical protein